jgi:hypothetical protein
MRFRVYLNGSNHWYLHSYGSCFDHKHHPKLDVAANTLSEKDLSDAELKLTNLLYNLNVPPSTIAKVLTTLRDDDVGTFLPKTLFNINEKCRSLIDVANRILPTCSDAEQTLILLQMYVDISILKWLYEFCVGSILYYEFVLFNLYNEIVLTHIQPLDYFVAAVSPLSS